MSLLNKFDELEESEIKETLPKKPTQPTNLNPPKIPTIVKPKTPKKIITKSKERTLDEITFGEIANSSEFKRLVYLIWFGKTHRGKSVDLERQLVKRKQEITAIDEYARGSKKDYKDVMSELKQVLVNRTKKLNL